MRIGIISDTHGYLDPALPLLLIEVDEILHAGDVGSRNVLDQLRMIAPIRAVRGNVDAASLQLPPILMRRYGKFQIYMLHELPRAQSVIREWSEAGTLQGKQAEQCREFLDSFPTECRIVIFGHSHEPCAVILADKLFLNPGSAGKKRFSLPRCCGALEISNEGVRATFLGLERYNTGVPKDVYLPLGGSNPCQSC